MFNLILIYWTHLKSSKRTILISSIGLIFALAILSGSILYINTKKVDIISEKDNPIGQKPYGIEINLQTKDVHISFNNLSSGITDGGVSLLKSHNINFLDSLELFYSLQGFTKPVKMRGIDQVTHGYTNISVTRYLDIVQLNDGIIGDLNQFLNANSLLPGSEIPNSSIIQGFLLDVYFGPSSDPQLQFMNRTTLENYVLNPLTNITQETSTDTAIYSRKIPINVTGYGKVVNFDTYYEAQKTTSTNYNEKQFPTLSKLFKIIPLHIETGTSFLFVKNITQVLSKINPLYYDSSLQRNIYGITENINGGYRTDLNKFDPFTINSKIDQMNTFSTLLGDAITNNVYYQELNSSITTLKVNFTDNSKLINISSLFYEILNEMLFYAIPMFVVSLLVTNYSFGLLQKKIINQVGIYKVRGASSFDMFLFQLIDYFAIVIFSTIIGMLLGIPIIEVVSKTNGLLNFTNPENYDVLTSFLSILIFLVVIAFAVSIVISFVTNIRRMIKLSKMTISESEIDTSGEKLTPFWEAHYLDVVVFLYGIISYLIINYYLYSPTTSGSILASGAFFFILFYPAPYAIFLGTILLANRLIPKIIEFIGTFLWKNTGGLLAFSFKNVIRHRQSSTRAIILITSLLTFLILFYSIPQSQVVFENRTSEYNLGGDVQITLPDTFIYRYNVQSHVESTLNSIQQTYGSYFKGITTVVTASYHSSSNDKTFKFIFIDPDSYLNGSSVSLFNLGLTKDLQFDLNQLKSPNHPVLTQTHFLSSRNVSIGDSFTLDFVGGFHDLTILDTFNQWPMSTRTALDYNTYYFVMDIHYFYDDILPYLFSTPYTTSFSGFFIANFNNQSDIHIIAPEISSTTGLTVTQANINLTWWTIDSQLIFNFRLGQINIDLLVSIIITITILLMFAYMQLIERRQEVFTERALGMKLRQIAFIFYIESLIILIVGIILGSLISSIFLNTIAVFASGGLSIPKYEIFVPYNLVYSTYTWIIIIASICAIIPAYYVTRQDIVRSFSEY